MKYLKKKQNASIGFFRKPGLIDRKAVEKYIELFGTPVCMCCNTITFLPVFRPRGNKWSIFCLNCGTTRDTIGTCLHQDSEDMSARMVNPKNNFHKIIDNT